MNQLSLPDIPPEMEHLDRDPRGLPIPFIVLRDAKGRADFRINDHDRVMACLRDGLCAISGLPMKLSDIWFVGGPGAAYHPNGAFLDPPAKKDCLTWSLKVCPFLVAKKQYSMKFISPKVDVEYGTVLVEHGEVQNTSPEYFVLARTTGFAVTGSALEGNLMHPSRPWMETEHWVHGKSVSHHSRAEVAAIMAAWQKQCSDPTPDFKKQLNRGRGANQLPWLARSRRADGQASNRMRS